ncbi:OmpA family protein [Zoogloea sp. LCSB751]|uniref:OmpA family protein n=1 Tax=Zoogloea sp. LCSB751 TaxID=1965277 RepID=UPI0009A54CE3|nr:OmpA family protein [Zoogloea sp. LCSB751]
MTEHRIFAMTLIALATLTGCSSQPPRNALLEQARGDYQMAQGNSEVSELASGEMKQANDALNLANEAAARGEKPAEVDHLAYLAKQRIAIAREAGSQKAAERAVNNAEAARDKVRLSARTTEADMAHRSADDARMDTREAQARNLQLENQLKALNAKQTPRGIVITIGDVLFDTNRAELKAGGMRNMEKLVVFLKDNPQRKAVIEGFTDSSGSDSHNQALSERRADSVMNRLISMGIGSERLSARGYGEAYPVAGNDSTSGRQMNRRVEIILSDESGNISSR